MYNSSPSLSPPTTGCQCGRYLNYDDLRQKVSGIPRMVYSNKIISLLTQASYQGWFAHETTVRSTNYSIGPLATALFNDPFSWLFGKKQSNFSIFFCSLCKILNILHWLMSVRIWINHHDITYVITIHTMIGIVEMVDNYLNYRTVFNLLYE